MPRIVSERLDGIFISSTDPDKSENAKTLQWPLKSDAACWNCAHTFDWQPIPIFRNYCHLRDVYEVWGHACSAGCAKQYLLDENLASSQQNITWQRQMMVDCFGWPCDKPLPCGKPWQMLRFFGGSKTIEEFRANNDPVVILTKQKFIPFSVIAQTHLPDTKDAANQEQQQQQQQQKPTKQKQDDKRQQKKAGELIAQAQNELTTLTGLKRPPEDQIIRTREQLQAAYPSTDLGMNRPSVFQNYLSTQLLPSEEECAEIRRKLQKDTKLNRKRKHPLPEGAFSGPAPAPMVGKNAVPKKQPAAQTKTAKKRRAKQPAPPADGEKEDAFRFNPSPASTDYGPPRSPDYPPPQAGGMESPPYEPTPAGFDYSAGTTNIGASDPDFEF